METKETPKIPRIIVGVLIYNDQGEIFLATCHKWKDRWVVPGGKLDWGETLHHCAKREVKEETNMDIDEIELIGTQESIFSEEFHEKKHMVFMDFSAKAITKDIVLNEELQEYKWIKPEDALELDLNPSTRLFIERFIAKKK
ncbi:NUDIX domain-containing protein [archaeon]|jgi:nucleoside triphosphatase|nr:NUDIX domain-containing protein [archaeon]